MRSTVETETRAKSASVVVFHCRRPRFQRTTNATSSIGGAVGTSIGLSGSCVILFNRSWVVIGIGSFHDRKDARSSPGKRARKILQAWETQLMRVPRA